MESLKSKVIYVLKAGDSWAIWNHHLVIANPAHPPFMIELTSGERKEIDINALPSRPPVE